MYKYWLIFIKVSKENGVYNKNFVLPSGSFLWLSQSSKDLFCVSDQNPQFHPSTVQLPSDNEMVYYSACRDAIWSLNSLGQVFIRTLSPNCPTGMHWTKLDLTQLGKSNCTFRKFLAEMQIDSFLCIIDKSSQTELFWCMKCNDNNLNCCG